jgi:hypothetical protein
MSRQSQVAVYFAVGALLCALPIVMFFSSLVAADQSLNKVVWLSLPIVAAVSSGPFARIILRRNPGHFGAFQGATTALLSLLACSLFAAIPTIGSSYFAISFVFVISAMLWFGWLALGVGALLGWICQRHILAKP